MNLGKLLCFLNLTNGQNSVENFVAEYISTLPLGEAELPC